VPRGHGPSDRWGSRWRRHGCRRCRARDGRRTAKGTPSGSGVWPRPPQPSSRQPGRRDGGPKSLPPEEPPHETWGAGRTPATPYPGRGGCRGVWGGGWGGGARQGCRLLGYGEPRPHARAAGGARRRPGRSGSRSAGLEIHSERRRIISAIGQGRSISYDPSMPAQSGRTIGCQILGSEFFAAPQSSI
jgi:hypothetical protein